MYIYTNAHLHTNIISLSLECRTRAPAPRVPPHSHPAAVVSAPVEEEKQVTHTNTQQEQHNTRHDKNNTTNDHTKKTVSSLHNDRRRVCE